MIRIIDIEESKKDNFFDKMIIVPVKPSQVIRKETKNLPVCPYCNKISVRIWVHGRYQCQRCKNIITGCCEVI